MTSEQAKDYIKLQLPDYLRQKGIDINNRKNFNCLCPEHNDSNPSMSYDREHNRVHCFGCGVSYDTFDLISIDYGVSGKELFEKAYKLYNISVDENGSCLDWDSEIGYTNNRSNVKEQTTDNTDFIIECQKHIDSAKQYLESRGISLNTAKHFELGYAKNQYIQGLKMNALIIPTAKGQYVARNTDTAADKKSRYRKSQVATLFNANALYTGENKDVFVVEGEIDALSIIEVGGSAVGLGSTANKKLLIEMLKDKPTEKRLLIALDNDESGRRAEKQLCDELKAIGTDFFVCGTLFGDAKDANEALINNKEQLAKVVSNPLYEEYKIKYSIKFYMQEFVDSIEKTKNTQLISTGFKQLDAVLDGGLYEGLYIIGAVSSLGKTTFTMQIADNIAKSGKDVMIFSLEMSKKQLISKSVSRLTYIGNKKRFGVTSRGITTGQKYESYTADFKNMIANAIYTYQNDYAENIYIYEGMGDIGVKEVCKAVEMHIKATGNTPVVFIDYIQILSPYNERFSDKQNADKNVTALKVLSRDFETPVFCISSLNRDSYKERISMSSFKESGGIEYGSDVLLGLQFYMGNTEPKKFDINAAKAKKEREIELCVLKNRDGKTGGVINYNYNPMFNFFEELSIEESRCTEI